MSGQRGQAGAAPVRVVGLIGLVVGLALAGCGKSGPLLDPEASGVDVDRAAETASASVDADDALEMPTADSTGGDPSGGDEPVGSSMADGSRGEESDGGESDSAQLPIPERTASPPSSAGPPDADSSPGGGATDPDDLNAPSQTAPPVSTEPTVSTEPEPMVPREPSDTTVPGTPTSLPPAPDHDPDWFDTEPIEEGGELDDRLGAVADLSEAGSLACARLVLARDALDDGDAAEAAALVETIRLDGPTEIGEMGWIFEGDPVEVTLLNASLEACVDVGWRA